VNFDNWSTFAEVMTKNKTYYFVREHGVYMYRCRSERVLDVEA